MRNSVLEVLRKRKLEDIQLDTLRSLPAFNTLPFMEESLSRLLRCSPTELPASAARILMSYSTDTNVPRVYCMTTRYTCCWKWKLSLTSRSRQRMTRFNFPIGFVCNCSVAVFTLSITVLEVSRSFCWASTLDHINSWSVIEEPVLKYWWWCASRERRSVKLNIEIVFIMWSKLIC